jgi:fructose/tagatose bisphosphate aldolase
MIEQILKNNYAFFANLFNTNTITTCEEIIEKSRKLNTPIFAMVARKKRKTFGGELTGELAEIQIRVFATPELYLKYSEIYQDESETRICLGLADEDYIFYDLKDNGWIWESYPKKLKTN